MSYATKVNAAGRPVPSEADVLKACLALLRFRRIFHWRQNQGAATTRNSKGEERTIRFTSINGVSDIIGVLRDGRFLAVECKRPGNGPTEEQKAFLDAVRRRGGVALIVYDVDDLAETLDSLERVPGQQREAHESR